MGRDPATGLVEGQSLVSELWCWGGEGPPPRKGRGKTGNTGPFLGGRGCLSGGCPRSAVGPLLPEREGAEGGNHMRHVTQSCAAPRTSENKGEGLGP